MDLTAGSLVEHAFRHEYGRLVAGLVRRLGTARLALAEDAVQTALVRAMQTWPHRGVPNEPAAWLRRAAYHAAVDALRTEARVDRLGDHEPTAIPDLPDDSPVADEPLRLLFLCCHPALPIESRVALSLKLVCGFGVGEIARGLLVSEAAILKRLTRAKDALAAIGPSADPLSLPDLAERRDAVMAVLYLLFNEGYHSSQPNQLIRRDICSEAIRQTDVLARHPELGSPAAEALLALMLLHAARFPGREDDTGRLVLLDAQDRSRWDWPMIMEGLSWLTRAARGEELSAYHVEAAIAAEHARATTYAATDWARIIDLYDLLDQHQPHWLHALNRAVAIGCLHGPQAGLRSLLAVEASDAHGYSHWHAALGELHRRCGHEAEARKHFDQAHKLAANDSERTFLSEKLADLDRE